MCANNTTYVVERNINRCVYHHYFDLSISPKFASTIELSEASPQSDFTAVGWLLTSATYLIVFFDCQLFWNNLYTTLHLLHSLETADLELEYKNNLFRHAQCFNQKIIQQVYNNLPRCLDLQKRIVRMVCAIMCIFSKFTKPSKLVLLPSWANVMSFNSRGMNGMTGGCNFPTKFLQKKKSTTI